MAWFFGCFGGGKKERNNGNAAPSFSKQKKPLQTGPVRIPGASAPTLGRTPAKEGTSREDLFTVRKSSGSASKPSRDSPFQPPPVCSSAPGRAGEGILLQGPERNFQERGLAAESTPEKQKLLVGKASTDPWSQLDELEEELEDLRRQIDRETEDAKKIRDEVKFLKSCGTLLHTPSEIRRRNSHAERQSTPEKAHGTWHSWLVRSSSPTSKLQSENHEDAQAASTPAKECHGLSQGVQTPVLKGLPRRTQINLDSSLQALPQATRRDENSEQGKTRQIEHLPKLSGDARESTEDLQRMGMVPSKAAAAAAAPSVSSPKVSFCASPDRQELFDIPRGSLVLPNLSFSRQAESMKNDMQTQQPDTSQSMKNLQPRPSTPENSSPSFSFKNPDASRIESANNVSIKKRRLRSAAASPERSPKPNVDVSERGDIPKAEVSSSSNLKRLKSGSGADPGFYNEEEPRKPEGLRRLSPIFESGTIIQDCHSLCSDGKANASSESISCTGSTIRTPGNSMPSKVSPTKSVSFTSTYCGNGTTEEEFSERSECSNSSSLDGGEEGSSFDTSAPQSSSSGTIEESASEFAPEHCFSPPTRRAVSDTGSSAAAAAARHYRGPATHPARYHHEASSSQEKSDDDDYDLFSDAVSHVSTKCSEREPGRHHPRRDSSMDSLTVQISLLARMGDPNDDPLVEKTPLKLSESLATPETDGRGLLLPKQSRLRSKPASSVLTPVENRSQWNQLKGKDGNPAVQSSKIDTKSSSARQILANTESWDEKKRARKVQQADEREEEGDTTAAAQAHVVRVDSSLSHWLKPCWDEPNGSSGITSGAMSLSTAAAAPPLPPPAAAAAPQSRNHTPPPAAITLQRQRSPAGSSTTHDRPILGAAAAASFGEHEHSSGARTWWDGKGIPNSTTKYKEDQKVSWHTTPFEVRLERALDKQGAALQKKLFGGGP